MHVVYPAVTSVLLFSIGVYGVLARRNAILVLMSVELMLNAVNLNLVTFDIWLQDRLHSGQVLTLFVIVIAAAEIGLGLAIVLLVFRNRRTVDIDRLRELADRDPADGQAGDLAEDSAAETPAAGADSGDSAEANSGADVNSGPGVDAGAGAANRATGANR
jgi:NADH-quinone oxidoreductase subunit K